MTSNAVLLGGRWRSRKSAGSRASPWSASIGIGVDIPAAAQQRGDRGDGGEAGRHREHHDQAVVERARRSASGKNVLPVSASLARGRQGSEHAGMRTSRCCTGLTPSTAANSEDTGGRDADLMGDRVRARRAAGGRGSASAAGCPPAPRSSARRTRRSTARCRSSGRSPACPTPRRDTWPGRCS